MNNDIGYSNMQALIVSGLTILVAMTFGWYCMVVLECYVAASCGMFVWFLVGHFPGADENENVRYWPYVELMRWGMVLWLMILHFKKG